MPRGAVSGLLRGRGKHAGRDLFIGVFFAIQLLLPLRGCIWNRTESRGTFSWNMYAQRYVCLTQHRLIRLDGRTTEIDHRWFLPWKKGVYGYVFNLSSLPAYHAHLCEQARAHGVLAEIRARARCQLNERPAVEIIDPSVDICTADNFGVFRSLAEATG